MTHHTIHIMGAEPHDGGYAIWFTWNGREIQRRVMEDVENVWHGVNRLINEQCHFHNTHRGLVTINHNPGWDRLCLKNADSETERQELIGKAVALVVDIVAQKSNEAVQVWAESNKPETVEYRLDTYINGGFVGTHRETYTDRFDAMAAANYEMRGYRDLLRANGTVRRVEIRVCIGTSMMTFGRNQKAIGSVHGYIVQSVVGPAPAFHVHFIADVPIEKDSE